jgi:hypothetical protein
MVQPDEVVDLVDFTPKKKRSAFTHSGEQFDIVSTIPLMVFPKFMLMGEEFSKLSTNDMQSAVNELKAAFELILTDESFSRFAPRLQSRTSPIGIEAIDIFTWAIGVLTDRPTRESSDSSNGSSNVTSGSDSTAGVPQPDAIL